MGPTEIELINLGKTIHLDLVSPCRQLRNNRLSWMLSGSPKLVGL